MIAVSPFPFPQICPRGFREHFVQNQQFSTMMEVLVIIKVTLTSHNPP